jgi:hypothetical protein
VAEQKFARSSQFVYAHVLAPSLPPVLQAVESKRVKLTHDGLHRNTKDYEIHMKPVVKGADTIPLGVGIEAGLRIVLLSLQRSGE